MIRLLLISILFCLASPLVSQADRVYGAKRTLWSLEPLRDLPLGASIDSLLARRAREAGVTPAPRASRRLRIRRLWFDVCGLPPPVAEVEAFLRDPRVDAWERRVDRALRTRAFAENQARHWLDIARYADTAGDASDFPLPDAWRYRDWVIEAFKTDMPWGDFVRAQLAGDALAKGSVDENERAAFHVATGFVALSRRFGVKVRQYPHLIREDSLETVGRSMLGLSLSCARCHDHKFDPITQEDYAALDGIFESTRYPHPGSEVLRAPADLVDLLPEAKRRARLAPWAERHRKAKARVEAVRKARKPSAELRKAQRRLAAVVAERPDVPTAYAVVDAAKIVDGHVQIGGVASKRGARVARRALPCVEGPETLRFDTKSSGRLALANWLVDPKHPLVPRVTVNRLWQQCFGRGIVATPDNFGMRGAKPVDRDLLDFLARRFVEEQSITKSLRRILLSDAYQRASSAGEGLEASDPENNLFARQSRRRLSAEAYRDSLLRVAGELELGSPGAHPFPPVSKWKAYSQHKPFFASYPSHRRSIYVMRQRLRSTGVFSVMDGADPCSVTGKRGESIVPSQALWLRNSDFVRARAKAFAKRHAFDVRKRPDAIDAHADLTLAVDAATRSALSRPATAAEVQGAARYLGRLLKAGESNASAWESWCHVLLCSNEFAYVD